MEKENKTKINHKHIKSTRIENFNVRADTHTHTHTL